MPGKSKINMNKNKMEKKMAKTHACFKRETRPIFLVDSMALKTADELVVDRPSRSALRHKDENI